MSSTLMTLANLTGAFDESCYEGEQTPLNLGVSSTHHDLKMGEVKVVILMCRGQNKVQVDNDFKLRFKVVIFFHGYQAHRFTMPNHLYQITQQFSVSMCFCGIIHHAVLKNGGNTLYLCVMSDLRHILNIGSAWHYKHKFCHTDIEDQWMVLVG